MRYVIIGQKDSSQLLVVDTQLMTVTPVDHETVVPSNVRSALAAGNTIVDGIDIAVACSPDDGSRHEVEAYARDHGLELAKRIPVDPFVTVVEKRSFTLKVFLGDALIMLCQVGLGESGKTPATAFTVAEKLEKPNWNRPDGQLIPYGHPENVLGDYFVKFKHPKYQGFGIHGTTDTGSIGKERSMGCIRLLPDDLARYFRIVPRGSQVIVRE